MNRSWIKTVFIAAGVYDVVLGLIFTTATEAVFNFYEVSPPAYLGYIQYPAMLILLFGIMFFHISRDPIRHRALIWYGVGMKAIYIVLTFWYFLTSDLPSMWLPWAWADLAFLVLFLVAWIKLKPVTATSSV